MLDPKAVRQPLASISPVLYQALCPCMASLRRVVEASVLDRMCLQQPQLAMSYLCRSYRELAT